MDLLRLEEAYQLLEQRYPVLGDTALIRQMEAMELELNDLNRLPEINLKGDGRFQSTSTRLESDNPMFPVEINQPLFNIRTYLEANYVLLDGGQQEARHSLIQLEKAAAQGELEVQRFALRKIINQLFLRISLLRTQQALFTISLDNLNVQQQRLTAAIQNGIALESEQTRLRVRTLELQAQRDNIDFYLEGSIKSLERWLGVQLGDQINLSFPSFSNITDEAAINRPELALFEKQQAVVLAKASLIEVRQKPKLNVFAQGGVGYPNPLNILDNNVAPYGLVGAGFTWTLKDWDKAKKEKSLLSLQAQRIEHAEETFRFNLEQQTPTYRAEVARLEQQIERNEAIAGLQKELLQTTAAQLEAGIITATEYLLQVNAELAARQQMAVLRAELQAVHLNYWNERGAF
jgi:outer membrane protein TolC